MNQTQIVDAISEALNNLYNWEIHLFDYWISELYDINQNEMWDKWNINTLDIMSRDIENVYGDLISEGRIGLVG